MGTKHYRAMRRTDYLDITAPCRLILSQCFKGRAQLLILSDDPVGNVMPGRRGPPKPRFEDDARGGGDE